WYNAAVSGNTATYHVSTSEHNSESGTYITHVYVTDKQGRQALAGKSVTVPAAASSSGSTAGSGDYSAVFDAQYYLSHYPDLQAAFGSDASAAYSHFLQYGMKEARQASANFNPVVYRNRYPDLNAAFGDRWELYYQHYIQYGIAENRSAV
ncbi:MAG: GBS Bsp-like repeat-containing protein, partial [Lachnospiraceae bacterium]